MTWTSRGVPRAIAAAVAVVGLTAVGTAAADDATRRPGVQAEPPGPPAVERAPLVPQRDGRAAVRGCPVGDDCRRPQDVLREFELETFGPRREGTGPWMEGGVPGPMLGEPVAPRPRVERPSELRPDLPWLDELELPDLPVRWDRRVIDYLMFYKDDPRGRRIMAGWLRAQGRYRDMIVTALRRARLPEDLLYVAMIESSYDAVEYSRAGASGLWQLMPAGGRIYGLDIDRWVDERNDPVQSTTAVLDYFADLHQRFGDWDLALAAYNAGYGAVIKAIARYNSNDFWQLLEYENALPWESGIYVPKALAAAIIGRNLERFGFADVATQPAERWDDVELPTSVALGVVAQAARCSVDDLTRLNPHLRRKRTPPGRKRFVLRVPAGGGAGFGERFAQLRGDWDGHDAYVVAHGQRFEDIATELGISKQKLRTLNEIDHESEIAGGTVLVVPRVSEEARRRNLEKAKESLYASGVDAQAGEPLIVAVPDKDAHVDGKQRVFYRVVHGDSLIGVARALRVDRAALARWNGLDAEARLHPRMVLQAWVDAAGEAVTGKVALLDGTRLLVVTRGSKEHLDLAEQRTGRVRLEYTAKKAESFEQIGKKFGLGPRDVARINRMPPETVVKAGETIVVYQVVDRSRSDRAAEQWRQAPKDGRGKPAKQTATAGEPAGAPPVDGKDDGKDDGEAADDADDADRSDDGEAAAPAAPPVEQPKPAAEKKPPAAEKKPPAAEKKPPAAEKKPPAVEKKPAAEKKPPAAADDAPVSRPGDVD